MTCFRGSYEDYLRKHSNESELPDVAVFFNTHLYEGGLGSKHYAPDLSTLVGSIGRGVIGLVTGSREGCYGDYTILQQLGWDQASNDGMGCGKLITKVEKNDLSPIDSDEDCNNFFFTFECQGWSSNNNYDDNRDSIDYPKATHKMSEVSTDPSSNDINNMSAINRVPSNAPKFLKDLIEKTGAKPYMIPRDKLY